VPPRMKSEYARNATIVRRRLGFRPKLRGTTVAFPLRHVRCLAHGVERWNQLDRTNRECDAETRRADVDGMIVSALIGLGALIIALLTIRFTPPDKQESERSRR